jgi:hypothetical protein
VSSPPPSVESTPDPTIRSGLCLVINHYAGIKLIIT